MLWLVRQDMFCSLSMLTGPTILRSRVLSVLQEKGERTAHATYLPPHEPPAAPPPVALALVRVRALPLALLLPGPPPQGLLLLLLPPPGLRARSMHQTAGRVSEKAVNEDHRHDRAIRNQKWEITLVTERMDGWATDRAAGERETHGDEKKSVDLSHRSRIELLRWKTNWRAAGFVLFLCAKITQTVKVWPYKCADGF